MTKRAKLTQAEIERFDRVGNRIGKVAVFLPAGVIYVDPASLPNLAPEAERPNSCDEAWR